MATNLLSDELKSDLTYLIPPITKELILNKVNALIWHFKEFGVCYESDIVYPSGTNYLASTTPQIICSSNHGSAALQYINKLDFLFSPVEFDLVVNQINLFIDILKSGTITSSYYFENLKNDIYTHTLSISSLNSFAGLDYTNDLQTKITNLEKLVMPVSYETLINILNTIIGLFKVDARIIDANDFRLLIYALKKEEESILISGNRDHGNAATSSFSDTIDYGNATSVTEEFQSNESVPEDLTSFLWAENNQVSLIINNVPSAGYGYSKVVISDDGEGGSLGFTVEEIDEGLTWNISGSRIDINCGANPNDSPRSLNITLKQNTTNKRITATLNQVAMSNTSVFLWSSNNDITLNLGTQGSPESYVGRTVNLGVTSTYNNNVIGFSEQSRSGVPNTITVVVSGSNNAITVTLPENTGNSAINGYIVLVQNTTGNTIRLNIYQSGAPVPEFKWAENNQDTLTINNVVAAGTTYTKAVISKKGTTNIGFIVDSVDTGLTCNISGNNVEVIVSANSGTQARSLSVVLLQNTTSYNKRITLVVNQVGIAVTFTWSNNTTSKTVQYDSSAQEEGVISLYNGVATDFSIFSNSGDIIASVDNVNKKLLIAENETMNSKSSTIVLRQEPAGVSNQNKRKITLVITQQDAPQVSYTPVRVVTVLLQASSVAIRSYIDQSSTQSFDGSELAGDAPSGEDLNIPNDGWFEFSGDSQATIWIDGQNTGERENTRIQIPQGTTYIAIQTGPH